MPLSASLAMFTKSSSPKTRIHFGENEQQTTKLVGIVPRFKNSDHRLLTTAAAQLRFRLHRIASPFHSAAKPVR